MLGEELNYPLFASALLVIKHALNKVIPFSRKNCL